MLSPGYFLIPRLVLPLYGPLELSRAVRSSLCSSTLPSALPHRNKDNAWSEHPLSRFFNVFLVLSFL